jgi:hypothetical protein
MMSRNQRLSFLGIAAVIAVVAVLVLTAGGGSDETEQDSADTAAQATATATATPGADEPQGDSTPTPTPTPTPEPQPPLLVAGKVAKLRFEEGETVRFRARSAQAEEIHVHGYDRYVDVPAGETVDVAFEATITGIFEVELHGSGAPLGELRVEPS